jgi:hypothetical protein
MKNVNVGNKEIKNHPIGDKDKKFFRMWVVKSRRFRKIF